jgi:hypothetical protein
MVTILLFSSNIRIVCEERKVMAGRHFAGNVTSISVYSMRVQCPRYVTRLVTCKLRKIRYGYKLLPVTNSIFDS